MTVLDRLLTELRNANGPLRSNALAARIGVSEPALGGMISVLVGKGKLAANNTEPMQDVVACSGVACGASCVGLDRCPFIAEVPESYALVIESVRQR